MNRTRLSIITITYNNPNLKRTLDSVLIQRNGHSMIEHIIVDNLSNDDTEYIVNAYIKKAPYQVTYIREKDKGMYDAMNKGIKVAKGDYLSFMNAGDHFYDVDSIKNILGVSGSTDIIYGNLNVTDNGAQSVYYPPDKINFNYFLHSALPHQASIIKRSLFDKIGLYDNSLRIVSDWEFFILSFCKYKCSYFHLNKIIATYYFNGISSRKENMKLIDDEKNKVLNKNFSKTYTKFFTCRKNEDKGQSLNTPVLFLIFNRPEITKKVFAEIREARPVKLYIASDGARKNKAKEIEVVEKTRDLVLNNIDWNCEVKTLFREENLGCGRAVSGAIRWFFDHESEGIILEDDCLPNQSFFYYCQELLNYYRENKKIMHISGDQFVPNFDNGASYYFAKNMHCWGWASWSDRWQYYEFNLINYDEKNIEKISNDKTVRNYWLNYLKRMKNIEIDTWDYQWMFKIFEKDGLCINPSKNLISNIGFGEGGGTNGFKENNPNVNLPTFEIRKIIHPRKVKVDNTAVEYIFRVHYGINLEKVMRESLKSIIFRFLRKIKKVYER